MFDKKAFRCKYPEFAQTPDVSLEPYIELAESLIDWPEPLRSHGIGLFVAHHAAHSSAASGSGGRGPVESESVDGVSVTYATSAVAEEGRGFWNATAYGREFIYWSRLMGAGGMQII